MFRTLATLTLASLVTTPVLACKMPGKDELFMNYIRLGERAYTEPVPLDLPEIAYVNAAGERTSLKEHFGKPLIVTLWHPRCTGCQVDLPELNAFLEQNPQVDPDQFVQISIERLFEGARPYDADDVKRYLDARSYGQIDVNLDLDNEMFRGNCLVATPSHLMINSEGKLTDVLFGAFPWPDAPFADDIRTFLATN